MTPPATYPHSGSRIVLLARWAAWTALIAILWLMFVPPALRPLSELPHAVEHFSAFLLTGAAFALAYPQQRLTMGIAALPITAVLELLQLFAPGRHARISDFIVNALGVFTGIAVIAAGTCRGGSR